MLAIDIIFEHGDSKRATTGIRNKSITYLHYTKSRILISPGSEKKSALILMFVQCTHIRCVHWASINISRRALDLNYFSQKKAYAFIEL